MRASVAAGELSREELLEGGRQLSAKSAALPSTYSRGTRFGRLPCSVGRPKAVIGLQEEKIGKTMIWVLPNPSGLNAHYQAKELGRLFSELKAKADSLHF